VLSQGVGVVYDGVTFVDDAGFPSLHGPSSPSRIGCNSMLNVRRELRVSEYQGNRIKEIGIAQRGSYTSTGFSPASHLSRLGEILSRLPEHLRYVMPLDEGKIKPSEVEDAVQLLLRY